MITEVRDNIRFHLGDCMELMAGKPDNYWGLAVVDPPYGIREDGHRDNQTRSKLAKSKKYNNALWDQPRPTELYFKELKRSTQNQIIWGANHLADLFNAKSSCWIVWNKKVMSGDRNCFADCELAYGSFTSAVRSYEYVWQGMIQGDMKNKELRIHPTQKPIKLYRWILQNYATKGTTILDTHGGSMTNAIACDMEGYSLDICEIDEEYFESGLKAFDNYKRQLKLF